MAVPEQLRELANEVDAMEADYAVLQADLDAALTTVETQEGAIDDLLDERNRLRRIVRKLRAELAELTAPPEPERVTVFGSSAKSSSIAVLEDTRATYGRLDIVRRFSSSIPTPGLLPLDGTDVSLSFKLPDRAAFVDTLEAARDQGIGGFWTYYHEPEDNVGDGSLSLADWRRTWDELQSVAAGVSGVTLEPLPILMAWTLNPKSGRDWRGYDLGLDVGFDCYNAVNVPYLAAWAEETGRRFAIPEIGATGTDVQRVDKLDSLLAQLVPLKPRFVAYFDATVGGDFPLGTNGTNGPFPEAAALWKSYAEAS